MQTSSSLYQQGAKTSHPKPLTALLGRVYDLVDLRTVAWRFLFPLSSQFKIRCPRLRVLSA